MKYSDVSAPILSTNKKYLKEIAKFCKKHGTKLVLISTPSTKNWNYQRHNTMEAISKYCEENGKSYTFINDDEVEINGKRYEIYRCYENGSRGNYGIKCKEK